MWFYVQQTHRCDYMPNPVLVKLLASGIAKGASIGYKKGKEVLLDAEFSENVDRLATKFNKALRDSVRQVAEDNEEIEFSVTDEYWQGIAEELNDLERYYLDDEEAVINQITSAIAKVEGWNLDNNPGIRRELNRVVVMAYSNALREFEEEIAGTELADQLGFASRQELLRRTSELKDQLEQLEKHFRFRSYYNIYTADQKGIDKAVGQLHEQRPIDFVDRSELSGQPAADKILILGRKGSGKTRALTNLLPEVVDQDLEHILVPREALMSHSDLAPLEDEAFEGDVLLVWDDIHDINPTGKNVVFEAAVRKLSDILQENGHNLRILVSARSENKHLLPGSEESFWADFDEIELNPLPENVLRQIFDLSLGYYEISASDEVREAFVQKALNADPSPFYVITVVSTANSELKLEDIRGLPKNAIEIWSNQYLKIQQNHEDARFILWSIKILSELKAPYYSSLVRGVYQTVFNRDKYQFDSHLKLLLEKQWVTSQTPKADRDIDDSILMAHDVQIEAIDESFERCVEDLSDFIFGDIENFLPEEERGKMQFLHNIFGVRLGRDLEGHNETAESHFEAAIAQNPEYATAFNNFANLLMDEGRLEEAEDHYQEAIRIDPDYSQAHVNYGILLTKQQRAGEAESRFQDALEINPSSADAHYNHAILLESLKRIDEALLHYEQAVNANPYIEQAHSNYAVLLEQQNQMSQAKHHYNRAISLNPGAAKAHYNLGTLYEDEGQLEDAIEHIEESTEILLERGETEEAVIDIRKLVELYIDDRNTKEAVRWCERALQTAQKHGLTDYEEYYRDLYSELK